MILAIISLSICALFSGVYTFVRLKTNNKWGVILSFVSMLSYVTAAVLVLFNLNNNFNNSYIFILLGIIFGLMGDIWLELKDERMKFDAFLHSGMIAYGLQRGLLFAALILLVFDVLMLEVFLISAAIAVALTVLILFTAKLIKIQLKNVIAPAITYFLLTTYFVSVAIWYAFNVPTIILLSLAFLMLFFSDLFMLKINLGNQPGKGTAFIIHNIFYAAANLLIIAFLYFSLF